MPRRRQLHELKTGRDDRLQPSIDLLAFPVCGQIMGDCGHYICLSEHFGVIRDHCALLQLHGHGFPGFKNRPGKLSGALGMIDVERQNAEVAERQIRNGIPHRILRQGDGRDVEFVAALDQKLEVFLRCRVQRSFGFAQRMK